MLIVSSFVEGAGRESGDAVRRGVKKNIYRYDFGCFANGLIFEYYILESLEGLKGRADRLIKTIAARWVEAKALKLLTALSISR